MFWICDFGLMAVPKKNNVSRKKGIKVACLKYVTICKEGHVSVKSVVGGLYFSNTRFCKYCLGKVVGANILE